MLIVLIQDLLQRKIEEEVQEPFLNLPIPGLGTVGVAAPHPIFWIQLSVVRKRLVWKIAEIDAQPFSLSPTDFWIPILHQCSDWPLYVLVRL